MASYFAWSAVAGLNNFATTGVPVGSIFLAFDALDFVFVFVAPPLSASAGAPRAGAAVAPPRTARAVADRRGARIAVAAVATRMHHANRRRGAMVLAYRCAEVM